MTLEEMFDKIYENANSCNMIFLPDSGMADEMFYDAFLKHQETIDDASCITLIPCTKTARTGPALAHYARNTNKSTLFVVYYDKLYHFVPRVRDDQYDPWDFEQVTTAFIYSEQEGEVITFPASPVS